MAKSRSKENPVGVFPLGWDHSDYPSHFISFDEARALRKSGAWYSFNHGKDIAAAGEVVYVIPEERQKSKWAILGQTSRPFARKWRIGPGFPQWVLAR